MKYKIFPLFSAFLVACSSDVEVNYKLREPVSVELYTESTYATMDLENEERVGTITADYIHLEYSQKGDTLTIRRNFEIDKSRGYLKNSHPAELQWRLPEVLTKGVGERVVVRTG